MKKKETKKKRAGNLRNNEREKKVNWDFVKLACYEENNDGVSYKWDDVKFVEGV